MPPDPRDPLQQRREALASWERNLRPRRDGHGLLWLALAAVLVFFAWQAAEWLLQQNRQRVEQRARPAAARSPVAAPPATARSTPENPVTPAPATPAERYGVTKCLSAAGKTEYADGPCPAGSRASTVWVQPDLNLADGLSRAQREASQRDISAIAAQVHAHERRVAQNTGGDVIGECAALDAHIRWIDAVMRQPQSGASMDEWSRQRRQARDRQFRLGCR